MTRSRLIEEGAGLLFAAVFAVAWWHPRYTWLLAVTVIIGGVALLVSRATSTAADRERQRRGAWMVPLATTAVAVLMVLRAAPEARMRSMLLASALVAAGFVLAWARRRAT